MKRVILFLFLACVMGGLGFLAGHFSRPDTKEVADYEERKELSYKLPLGQFTMQVVRPSRFLNYVFVMDVYITGARNFERMNGGLSRNQMREDVIRLLSNMVETSLWVEDSEEITPDALGTSIAQKLTHSYPMIKSVEISDLVSSRKDR